jgi:hypothetical protein
MIVIGLFIIHSFNKGYDFKPLFSSIVLALTGSGFIFFSFMRDLDATLFQKYPRPFLYEFLIIGELLYVAAFFISYRKTVKQSRTVISY